MDTLIAHFTAHELPGTLGLALTTFGLGLLAAHRQLRPRWLTIPLLALLAITVSAAVVADQPALHAPTWLALLSDVLMLVSAVALCLVCVFRARPVSAAHARAGRG